MTFLATAKTTHTFIPAGGVVTPISVTITMMIPNQMGS